MPNGHLIRIKCPIQVRTASPQVIMRDGQITELMARFRIGENKATERIFSCPPAPSGAQMNKGYVEVISLFERLHRHFLEVVRLELDRLGVHDINNVQGLLLFNIGDAEMAIGALMLTGCYLGSNVSYNVKKMVENGYLAQERSAH